MIVNHLLYFMPVANTKLTDQNPIDFVQHDNTHVCIGTLTSGGVNKVLRRDVNMSAWAADVIRNVPRGLNEILPRSVWATSNSRTLCKDRHVWNISETRAFLYCSKYVAGLSFLPA